jgi:hypothetical protein
MLEIPCQVLNQGKFLYKGKEDILFQAEVFIKWMAHLDGHKNYPLGFGWKETLGIRQRKTSNHSKVF